jgi:hypothetical protein
LKIDCWKVILKCFQHSDRLKVDRNMLADEYVGVRTRGGAFLIREGTHCQVASPVGIRHLHAEDLATHTHTYTVVWSIRNWSLAITPSLSPLLQLLLAEGHLTPTQVDHWQRLYPPEWAERPKFITVHALGEPFVVPLGRKKVIVAVVGRNKVGYFRMYTDFLGEGFYRERKKWFHG